ncbi:hypothetical protein LMH87_010794 [Akanthomyces muscarius]|uniref:Uncharacterized protein n=1 Tax=Akanthomyces muscarius TaxID=2231603 RepID=A0A9W8Q8G9_AKAMU|nr:hypothetical protein LMH87_010794 [Akanthomyces muscarius]KAJ4150026.1 hypothetical protein LMH87_010794 [Akanthomyces muscarius]
MKVYGCSGRGFTGHCETFSCPFEGCCQLPRFFQTSLVSVKSAGSYGFRLFTSAGCQYHCNDNDNGSRQVDSQGWGFPLLRETRADIERKARNDHYNYCTLLILSLSDGLAAAPPTIA